MNDSLNASVLEITDAAAPDGPCDLAARIAGLFVYPVKSCAGVRVEQALLLDTGLEFDRAWMVVDGDGNFLTQRELPRMALVQPQLKTFEMVLRAPGMLALHIALDRVEAPATPAQKKVLAGLSPQQVGSKELAGEAIIEVLTQAPGNGASIGGVKVVTENGWFAARPSGTEAIYKIYAESFKDAEHLRRIIAEAQTLVDAALAGGAPSAA